LNRNEIKDITMDAQLHDYTLAEPRLYILVRTDIPQLNPGKLGAQAAHAGTKFMRHVLTSNDAVLHAELAAWEGDRGFGTKITLAATEAQIHDAMVVLNDMGLLCSTVVDPSYPMTNYFGDHFTREELTCAYVFAPRTVSKEALAYLRKFSLHP
jgi:peptidyl-tRNA hydrolase